MSQPQPRPQSRLNDFQMLQQQNTFSQLQELREYQFQESGDPRQQSVLDQQSMKNKQVYGNQYPALIHGTPIHDASQRFMVGNLNFVHHGVSPVQGFANEMGFPQVHHQPMHSTGVVSPQLGISLYGTPVASASTKLGPYSSLLGDSHDSMNVLEGKNYRAEKPIVHSSVFSNSLRRNDCDDPSDLVCVQQGKAFESGQGFHNENLFGRARISNSEALAKNFQQVNMLQRHTQEIEHRRRQEQAGWPGAFSEKVEDSPSHSLCSLDPLEQKILFDMNDDNLTASFGINSNIRAGGYGNTENKNKANAFLSLQSGSWSALMQSAVAESSSSDTGLQEEWSGVSFQNPEPSSDNQPSNFIGSGKPYYNWVDNSLKCASSPSSRPQLQGKSKNTSSSFPGSQQSGIQFSMIEKQGMHLEVSNESCQKSPKVNSKWLDCHPQQKHGIKEIQPVQRFSQIRSAWPGNSYDLSESDAHRQSSSSSTNGTQASYVTGAASKELSSLWKTGDNHMAVSLSNSVGGMENAKYGHVNISTRVPESQQFLYMKGSSGTYKNQQCFQREKYADSCHSDVSRQTMSLRENDSRHVADGPSGQALVHQIPQGLNGHALRFAEQFKFYGNISGSGMDLDKGNLLDIGGNLTESPRNNIGSHTPDASKGSFGFYGPGGVSSVSAQMSQNMLELLHKVDNSKDYQHGMQFGSKESASYAEVPQTEISDASASQSQFFGLRLSPPTEQVAVSNLFGSSQNYVRTGNSSGTVSLGFSNVRNQVQISQQVIAPFITQSQESHLISTRSYGQEVLLSDANLVSQHLVASGTSRQDELMSHPNIWTTVLTQRNLSNTERNIVPSSLLTSPESTTSGLETASTVPRELHNRTYFKGGGNKTSTHSMNSEYFCFQGEDAKKETTIQKVPSGTLDQVLQRGKFSYEQESSEKSMLKTNAISSGSMKTNSDQQGSDRAHHHDRQAQKFSNLEVFGRSLKPSHVPSQNYSHLHQLQFVRNVHNDPSKEVVTKYSGVNSDLNVQKAATDSKKQFNDTSDIQNVANNELKSDSQADLCLIEEDKMHHFSSEVGEKQSTKFLFWPPIGDSSEGMVAFGQTESLGVPHATMHSLINLQMAPSQFKHFGTQKNGQMLPMFDPRDLHQFNPSKPFQNVCVDNSIVQVNPSCAAQGTSSSPTTSNTLSGDKRLSTPCVFYPDVSDQNLAVLGLKKRKYAAFELLPWYKEVAEGPQRLLDVSLSDLEWAEAANRIIEKVGEAVATIEDASIVRSRKRLILTTKIMQSVFRPPAASVLSGVAASNCDSVAYFTARLALGDACRLSSSMHMPYNIYNMSFDKPKTTQRNGDEDLKKLVQDYTSRLGKLEADFLILDNTALFSDIKLELQDLEKFSIMNRFAKFHSKGQVGAAETSTSSGTTRVFPQRYVIAAPMPNTVPEGAECLSL